MNEYNKNNIFIINKYIIIFVIFKNNINFNIIIFNYLKFVINISLIIAHVFIINNISIIIISSKNYIEPINKLKFILLMMKLLASKETEHLDFI